MIQFERRSLGRGLVSAMILGSLVVGCREGVPPSDPPAPATDSAAALDLPVRDTAAVHEGSPHDVTGGYFTMSELPAEFSGLDHLLLATIDEHAAPAPLNGFLRPKKATAPDYVLLNPQIEGRRLTFTTTEEEGISYAFDGTFEILGNFPENPPDYETVVLGGTLTKTRDGRTIASTPVRFRYEAGG